MASHRETDAEQSIDEIVRQFPDRLEQMPDVLKAAFDLVDAHISFEAIIKTSVNPTGDIREYQRIFPELFQVRERLRPMTVEEFSQKFVSVYGRYWDSQRQVFIRGNQPVYKEQARRAISEGILYYRLDMMFLNEPRASVYVATDGISADKQQSAVEANSFLSNAGNLLDKFIQESSNH